MTIGKFRLKIIKTVGVAFYSLWLANVAQAQTDWTTAGFGPHHRGWNPYETILSTANVGTLTLTWAVTLNGPILTQPTLLSGVATAQGSVDLAYVATLSGTVYALNAANGGVVWQTTLPTVQTNCSDFQANGGVVGVIDTPTIDRANNRLFVVAADGALHALNIANGTEMPGYPLQVMSGIDLPPNTLVYGSPTFDPTNGWLYIGTASTCDFTPWFGQVIKVDVNTPQVLNRWFTIQQQGVSGGGIWGPGGVTLSFDFSRIYALTGNARATPEDPPYAESVVALTPDLTLAAVNTPALRGFNVDFGATAVMFEPLGCPNELAAMNKVGALFIFDADDAGITNGPRQRLQISGGIRNVENGNFIGMPAYDPIRQRFFLGNPANSGGVFQHGLIALNVQPDCTVALAWQVPVGLNNVPYDNPMIPPVVANGVVYYSDGDASEVFAFDADTGQQLWSTGSLITGGVLAAPTVVNGHLFVSGYSNSTVYAFSPQ